MKKYVLIFIIVLLVLVFEGCNFTIVLKDTSNGNLINQGILVRDQDALFFSDRLNGGLYTLKEDGTDFKILLRNSAEFLNINNGTIYFVSGNTINRVKEDGTSFKKIYKCDKKIQWMKYRVDSIYFVSEGCFNIIDDNGTGFHNLLKENNISNVNLSGNKIYYTVSNTSNTAFSICSYDVVSKCKKTLRKEINGNNTGMIFQNNFLYYSINNSEGTKSTSVNAISLIDNKNEILYSSNGDIENINVSKQWLYYVNKDVDGSKTIYRFNTITKNKEKVPFQGSYQINRGTWELSSNESIPKKSFKDLNVLGNWIFYSDNSGSNNAINAIKLK